MLLLGFPKIMGAIFEVTVDANVGNSHLYLGNCGVHQGHPELIISTVTKCLAGYPESVRLGDRNASKLWKLHRGPQEFPLGALKTLTKL